MLYDYEFQAIVNWSYFAAIAKSRRAHTLITGFSSHLEFDLNTYQVDWLSQIETQRANKFYRKFHFRGKAKSDDLCAVVKDPNKEIIASGIIRRYHHFELLIAVAVAPHLQKKGIGRKLLKTLSTRFTRNTFTFPYSNLVHYYDSLGFDLVEPASALTEVLNLYHRYLNQGRDIKIMRSSATLFNKQE